MMARSSVLALSFDACDPAIAQSLAQQGHLPAFRKLFEHSGRCRVRSPVGVYVGALWVSFATGLRADRHGVHCWDEIEIESYERQLITPVFSQTPFWRRLSDCGHRVAVLDVPHMKTNGPVNGIELFEWGCHDRHFGLNTWPHGLANDIHATFGFHPIFGVNPYACGNFAADDCVHREGMVRTLDEDRALFDGLLSGLGSKRQLSTTLRNDSEFDFFMTVFGESHAIGHQQWHLHDSTHPHFDPERAEALGGDPILQIYRELDVALGEMLSLRDEDGTFLLLLSHGMGPHYDGTHLLDEILARIDQFDRGDAPVAPSLLHRSAASLPAPLQRYVTAFAVPALRRRAASRKLRSCPELVPSDQRSRQRFFLEPNNFACGGIRLNLIGREPRGCVTPEEMDQVCAKLAKDLHALVNLDTGRPVVTGVERTDRLYRRTADDTLPDLFVYWERSSLTETVWSPKTGIVHGEYTHWRTGDHRPDGLLLAVGPGIPTATNFSTIDIEDLAPSISARLGVTLDDVDGRVIPWIAGSSGSRLRL